MKQLLSILILLWIWIMGGCRSAELPAPLPEVKYGTVSCDMNDTKWNGVVEPFSINSSGNSYLQLFKFTTNERFFFARIQLKTGKYPVRSVQSSSTEPYVSSGFNHSNSDVLFVNFDVAELDGFENYFELTSIDLDAKEIEGAFQVAYVSASPYDFDPTLMPGDSLYLPPDYTLIIYPDIPRDTILLRNGIFKAYLED